MSNPWTTIALLLSLILIQAERNAYGKELQTNYATITYSDDELLNKFNKNITLTRQLRLMMRNKKIFTIQDEVKGKVDIIVEKVETVLEMFPNILQFNLNVLATAGDVQQVYQARYGKRADHIAYYSLKDKTITISTQDASLRVLSHEIGHVVVDHYYKIRTPSKIQEVLAQYAEKYTSRDE
ncbi:MAG: hypothetical protein FP815_06485 [Desulfobulbaceae bacterium]|nr:hypothetical protein [Desulfobulbaceae bacterium]MDP2107164.1 hypothetical protein [Desulfobulbaceae bacterium]